MFILFSFRLSKLLVCKADCDFNVFFVNSSEPFNKTLAMIIDSVNQIENDDDVSV